MHAGAFLVVIQGPELNKTLPGRDGTHSVPRIAGALGMLAALGTPACGTTHLARPMDAGMTRVSLSLGGPAVLGVPLPSPLTTLGVAHGVTDAIVVHGDLHPTAAAVGVAGADIGVAVHPIPNHRAELTVGGAAYGFVNRRDNLALADGWLSSGTKIGDLFFVAGGAHLTSRLTSSSEAVQQQQTLVPTLFALLAFRPRGQVEVQLEPRWYAFTTKSPDSPVGVISPGGLGAFGLLIGATYEFGNGVR
jgi:hypothetical protein